MQCIAVLDLGDYDNGNYLLGLRMPSFIFCKYWIIHLTSFFLSFLNPIYPYYLHSLHSYLYDGIT